MGAAWQQAKSDGKMTKLGGGFYCAKMRAKFRGELLGPTEPSTAPETSLRGIIYNDWEALGLKAQPTTGENGVHASASPFEACAEMNNWLGTPFAETAFG